MERLNYDILEKSGYEGYVLKDAPIKVLQFGEGNFLRAFVDFFFDISNEIAGFNGKVMLVAVEYEDDSAEKTETFTNLNSDILETVDEFENKREQVVSKKQPDDDQGDDDFGLPSID